MRCSPEQRIRDTRPEDQSESQPRSLELPLENHHVVREPTPGIDMNSESTRESLISCAHLPLLRTSPLSRLMHQSMSTLLCPEDECYDSFLERVYSTLIEHQCGIRLPRFANELECQICL